MARLLSVVGFALLCTQSKSLLFQDPLDSQDIDDLFHGEWCVEGALSVSETGTPIINLIPLFESPDTLEEAVTAVSDKSPLSLINELATYNNIQYVYNLTEEQGPPHKKTYGVYLELGCERFFGEGYSIKKARREAAKLALNSTNYEHPPPKQIIEKPTKYSSNPVDRLNTWANKRGLSTTYIYNDLSIEDEHSENFYHRGMYSESENIHIATVKIGNHEFNGKASTLEEAKTIAASSALKRLQDTEGFCLLENSEKSLIYNIFNSNFQDVSPVSLINEFSSKTKLDVSFDLISEEGPAHIKKFVYNCRIDNKYESTGEGSSKKEAKTQAAKNMLNYLKSLPPLNPQECKDFVKEKKKNKKKRNLIKNVQNIYDDEDDSNYYIPDNIDPISRLIQIQQANHDMLPTFRMKEYSNQTQGFYIEVIIGELSFIGSGPNKKIAKKKAAEGMLELMGYSIGKSTDKKKSEFRNSHKVSKSKPLVPGLNFKFINPLSDQLSLDKNQSPTKPKNPDDSGYTADDISSSQTKYNMNDKKTERGGISNPKKEIKHFAQQLGIKFQFSDFPKSKDLGFYSLLALTTNPPTLCYGTGVTKEKSQDHASLNALHNLYKYRLNSISGMLIEPLSDSLKNVQLNVEEGNVINPIVIQETE